MFFPFCPPSSLLFSSFFQRWKRFERKERDERETFEAAPGKRSFLMALQACLVALKKGSFIVLKRCLNFLPPFSPFHAERWKMFSRPLFSLSLLECRTWLFLQAYQRWTGEYKLERISASTSKMWFDQGDDRQHLCRGATRRQNVRILLALKCRFCWKFKILLSVVL